MLKRGHIRDDGMVFWGYGKRYKGGAYWMTPDGYLVAKERHRRVELERRNANKEQILRRRREIYKANPEKNLAQSKAWAAKNRDWIRNYSAKYRDDNRLSVRKYFREYQRNRKGNDPIFKLRHNIIWLIWNSLRDGGVKKSQRTEEILGCKIPFFKAYIEQRFLPGMSWENRSEWHLDHITPVASADTEKKLIKLNHYTNFRPLWAADNIRKGDKMNEQLTLLAA
jgi:hypothetical protein